MSKKLTGIAAAGVLLWGLTGTASAIPMIQITGDATNTATPHSANQTSWTNVGGIASSANYEEIGDPGAPIMRMDQGPIPPMAPGYQQSRADGRAVPISLPIAIVIRVMVSVVMTRAI